MQVISEVAHLIDQSMQDSEMSLHKVELMSAWNVFLLKIKNYNVISHLEI